LNSPKLTEALEQAAAVSSLKPTNLASRFSAAGRCREIVKVTDEFYFDAAETAGLKEKLRAFAASSANRAIDVSSFKELAVRLAKYAHPCVLEYFDRREVSQSVRGISESFCHEKISYRQVGRPDNGPISRSSHPCSEPHIPLGTELDLHEGKCFVSLVGFMFLDTRVKEFLVPYHVNFEEVNPAVLCSRATDGEVRRGVVFIKEIVPACGNCGGGAWKVRRAIRMLEDVRTSATASTFGIRGESARVENTLSVGRGKNLGVPDADSHGEFIIEHYWGYTKRGSNRSDEYKVEHPKWELFTAEHPHIAVDFGKNVRGKVRFSNQLRAHILSCWQKVPEMRFTRVKRSYDHRHRRHRKQFRYRQGRQAAVALSG
jgi:hypothetical protein